MQGLDELSSDAREYLHSKLIQDTGITFLDIENYEKQGYIIRQAYAVSGRNPRRIPTLPLAISVPLMVLMSAILAMQIIQYLSQPNKDEEQKTRYSVKLTRAEANDALEDKIQVFFPDQTPLAAQPVNTKLEITPDYKVIGQDSPTPEEIAYVSAFKSYLDNFLRRTLKKSIFVEKFIFS